jgi:competence protein ComEC
MVWCGISLHERPVVRMTILPLNGGHAVYVQIPGSGDWLIDCGNETSAATVLKPFLQAQGVNHLSNLVLTHGEIAYSGGAQLIAEEFVPRNLYTSPVHFRSPTYRDFQLVAAEQSDWRNSIHAGQQLGPFTVLYPSSTARTPFPKATDNALVLLGEFHSARILLLSDLGHLGQNALLSLTQTNPTLLRADIVIAAPPGDDAEPLSEALLNAIQPRVIIIADSRQPANKRAGAPLKERLGQKNVPVFYTSACDAVTLTMREGNWELKAMDGSWTFGGQK